MACEFNLQYDGNPEAVLARAKKTVERQGGSFSGDAHKGEFEVLVFGNKIAGVYLANEQTLHITITEKPFIIPCSSIESFLKGQLT